MEPACGPVLPQRRVFRWCLLLLCLVRWCTSVQLPSGDTGRQVVLVWRSCWFAVVCAGSPQHPSFVLGSVVLGGTARRFCVLPRRGGAALHPICFLSMIQLGEVGGTAVRAGWLLLSWQEWRFRGRKHTVVCWLVGFVGMVRSLGVLVGAKRLSSLPFPSMRPLSILLQVGSITLELGCPATLLWGSARNSRKRTKRPVLVTHTCGKTGIEDIRMRSYDPNP